MGIICLFVLNRINWSAKIWGGGGVRPLPPGSYGSVGGKSLRNHLLRHFAIFTDVSTFDKKTVSLKCLPLVVTRFFVCLLYKNEKICNTRKICIKNMGLTLNSSIVDLVHLHSTPSGLKGLIERVGILRSLCPLSLIDLDDQDSRSRSPAWTWIHKFSKNCSENCN